MADQTPLTERGSCTLTNRNNEWSASHRAKRTPPGAARSPSCVTARRVTRAGHQGKWPPDVCPGASDYRVQGKRTQSANSTANTPKPEGGEGGQVVGPPAAVSRPAVALCPPPAGRSSWPARRAPAVGRLVKRHLRDIIKEHSLTMTTPRATQTHEHIEAITQPSRQC